MLGSVPVTEPSPLRSSAVETSGNGTAPRSVGTEAFSDALFHSVAHAGWYVYSNRFFSAVDANTIEATFKRNGKVDGVSHMSVSSDGKTIHVVFNNKENGNKIEYDLEKQS